MRISLTEIFYFSHLLFIRVIKNKIVGKKFGFCKLQNKFKKLSRSHQNFKLDKAILWLAYEGEKIEKI